MRSFRTAVLLAAMACSDRADGSFHPTIIDSALSAALAADTGAIVSLDSLGPKEWSALYVFGPYSQPEVMRRCVAPSAGMETYGLAMRDDISALYFKLPDGRVSSMTLRWGRILFDQSAMGREYVRGSASFIVRYDTTYGRKKLWPVGAPTGSCS